MKRIVIFIVLLLSMQVGAVAQHVGPSSAPDPFAMSIGNGEPDATTIPSPPGYTNTNGQTVVSSVPSAPTTIAVIIYVGQSLIENSVNGTYTTTHAGSLIFNMYDRGTYPCKQPVLGTSWAGPGWSANLSPNGNNIICQIEDDLIAAGTYTSVIIEDIAIGGTMCLDWNTGGKINKRIQVAVGQLAAQHLTPATGFTGDFFVVWHQGESSGAEAGYAACLQNIAALFSAAGTGTSRFFIPQAESWSSGAVQSSVVSGQAAALAACSSLTCRAGSNWDSLGNADRQDTTHFNQTGAASGASLDATVITNCHNLGASCFVFTFGAFGLRRRPSNDNAKRRAAA
jgi:hypothetical protein